MSDKLTKVSKLLSRYNLAESRARLYKSHLEEIYNMTMPNRNIWDRDTKYNVGESKAIPLYDTTGVIATQQFVSQTHMAVTPFNQEWFDLEAGENVKPEERNSLNEALKVEQAKIFKFLNFSNFHQAINESYFDLSAGTGALVCNAGTQENPLLFSSVAIAHMFPEEGPYGKVETVWRLFKELPIRQIKSIWPDAELSSELENKVAADCEARIDIVEGTIYDEKKGDFEYLVTPYGDPNALLLTRIKSSPWIVFRAQKLPHEVYGRGPGDHALNSLQSLNKIFEFELRAAAYASNPIFLGATQGIFNPWTIQLRPGTIIPVDTVMNPPLAPLPQGGNPEFTQVLAQDLRQQINKLFFTDPLGEIDSPVRTATEMTMRQQTNLENKAPFFGRLQVELLDPLIQRIVFVLQKFGILQPFLIDGKQVTVKYKSPLLQTQGMKNISGLNMYSQTLQQMVGPELTAQSYNLAEIPLYVADQLDLDPKLIKSPEQIAMQQMAQQQQIAQQQAELPQAPTGGFEGGQLPNF